MHSGKAKTLGSPAWKDRFRVSTALMPCVRHLHVTTFVMWQGGKGPGEFGTPDYYVLVMCANHSTKGTFPWPSSQCTWSTGGIVTGLSTVTVIHSTCSLSGLQSLALSCSQPPTRQPLLSPRPQPVNPGHPTRLWATTGTCSNAHVAAWLTVCVMLTLIASKACCI